MKLLVNAGCFIGCAIAISIALPIWTVCLIASMCNTSLMTDDEDPCEYS